MIFNKILIKKNLNKHIVLLCKIKVSNHPQQILHSLMNREGSSNPKCNRVWQAYPPTFKVIRLLLPIVINLLLRLNNWNNIKIVVFHLDRITKDSYLVTIQLKQLVKQQTFLVKWCNSSSCQLGNLVVNKVIITLR